MTAERAQKQRGEEQSAAKAAAERQDRGDRLEQEHAGDHRQRDRDKAREMQRAVSRRHHLRRRQREQADGEAAERRAQRLPEPGLCQQRLAQRHAAHDGDADQRRHDPEHRRDREVAPEHVADRTDADADRQRRKRMRHEIAGHRGDADRRQAGRRIAADHQLEGIEGAGQRRAECAGDRRRGAAAHHDALVGAAQMKAAAERCREPAGQLGIARFQSDRGADAAGPDRLQRYDDAAAKRHPPAMQGIGLDRVDFARRPPAQQQQERYAEQEAAEARHQKRPPRLDAELGGQPVAPIEVEQRHMQRFDRRAHRGDREPADGADQERQYDQARFMRANERPQPLRCFKITRAFDHFAGSVDGRKRRPPRFSCLHAGHAIQSLASPSPAAGGG